MLLFMRMVKYQIDGSKFIIEDYQKAKRFSSFLPAIAGEDGKPLWAFYANVGQAIGGFGITSKEYPVTPFDSAFLAYSNIPVKGFRTFIKVDDEQVMEPFSIKDVSTLIVERSKITIKSSLKRFDIEISYSTISHKYYPGFIRKVVIKNKDKKHKYQIVDGLPVFLPKGASNYEYHELTTLVAAYCKVDLNDNAPFYTYTNRGGDEAKVVLKKDGNAFVSIDKYNQRLNSLVDSTVLFGHDDSFINPLGFDSCFSENINQSLSNQIPCAFSTREIELDQDEEYSFISLFTSFDSEEDFNKELANISYDFLEKSIDDTESLVESLLPTIKTSNKVLDEYIKQCFLDNGLRGGFPIQKEGKTLYLYSRKHGDMERDYNAFNIPSTYFSSGLGNYRDINQNRRNDLYLNPEIKDSNIHLFMSLIEANGFNPLLVDVSILDKDYANINDAIKAIKEKNPHIYNAKYIEGYWIDHFDYNLDLIENYLSIYPDKKEELFFKTKYQYFDSHIHIKPRKERYVLLDDGKIRQYNSLEKLNGLESDWLLDENGNKVETNLASKLFSLIAIKFSYLDVDQMGIEMSTNKPGWNDSCNGLPGLFGSSMNETIELLRLVKFYKKEICPFNKNVQILRPLNDLLSVMVSEKSQGFEYWNKVNTAKEIYEDNYRYSSLMDIDKKQISNALDVFESILEKGIKCAISINNNAIPTYFAHEVSKYHMDNGLVVDEFKTLVLPNFLEAPARLLKLGKDYYSKEQIGLIDQSSLLDKQFGIYKTSVSLEGQNKELGRICSFNAGWLERESDFLHMTFKYLLGLLKAGYYKEFFEACKNNLPCFMNPNIYGRSIFENVSFIVPSNHSNESLHGQGFYARLTGANTEIINMLYLLCFGKKIFDFVNNNLTFVAKPHIPLTLFDNGEIVIPLFKDTNIHFINKNNRDFDQQNSVFYLIDNHEYENVPNDVAIKIRNKEIKEIFVIIK